MTWKRAGVAVFVLGTIVGWAYVLFFADTTPPDHLADRSFAAAAGPICSDARRQIRDAGLVNAHADSPQQRGDLTAQADAILRTMVSRLHAVALPAGDDGRIVTAWLADWDSYLGDRDAWVAKLRTGDGSPFFEHSHEGGEPSSKTMDVFTATNDIDDCATPDGF